MTVFWICVCSILLAGYDFAPTSRFAFGLFVALLGIVALFAVRLIREWISPPRAAERQASVQG